MVVCTAINCSNSSRIKNMRFFKFPNEEIRRNVWLKKSGLEKEPGAFAKLCEVHFEEDQFEQNRLDGWKKLKPNAVPTLFQHKSKEIAPAQFQHKSKVIAPALFQHKFKEIAPGTAKSPDSTLPVRSPKRMRRWRKILPAIKLPSPDTQLFGTEPNRKASDMDESDIIIESVFTVAKEEGDGIDAMTETSEVEMVRMNKKRPALKHRKPRVVKPKRNYKSGMVVKKKMKTEEEEYNLFSSPLCTNGMQIVDVGEIIRKYVPDTSSLPSLKKDPKPEPEEDPPNGYIESLQKEIELKAQHQKEIEELKTIFRNRRKWLNAENMTEIRKLRARNQKLMSENETLIKRIDELEDHEDEMRKENEAMLGEIQEFVQNNKVMSNVIADLEKHNSELSTKLSEVKKSLKDISALNHHYKIQLSVYLSREQINRLHKGQVLDKE